MVGIGKRAGRMKEMRSVRWPRKVDTINTETSAEISTETSTGASMATDLSADIVYEAHWEGLSESEEESDIEISEPEDNISEESKNAFERLHGTQTPLLRSYLTNEGLPCPNANKLVIGVSNVIFSTPLKLIVSQLPGFSRRLCPL